MKVFNDRSINWWLALVMIAALASGVVRAEGNDSGNSDTLRPFERRSSAPIGTIESLGVMTVGGNRISGQSPILGGEILQAPIGMSARVSLQALGRVTLIEGASARLWHGTVGAAPDAGRGHLLISLLSGAAVVRLEPGVGAQVEAAGSTFAIPSGSGFRVEVRGGMAVIDALGAARLTGQALEIKPIGKIFNSFVNLPQQAPQAAGRRYLIRPVGLSSQINVRARSTRQIQVRVTDENDRPVPDIPVIFTLATTSGNSVGTLGAGQLATGSLKVLTNAQGIASAPFNAGAQVGSASITANVEGTNYSWVGQVNLIRPVPGFFSAQNFIPVVATATAAAVGATVATREDRQDVIVRPAGPPIIVP